MADLDKLRDLAEQVHPPAFDSLVTTAKRRGRRAAALTGAAVIVALLVGADLLTAGVADRSAPPADDPSRTSEKTPDPEPTLSPKAGEVLPLSRDTRWATMRQGRYAVEVTASLRYELDVPDRWKVLSGRFLNTPPSGASSIFFASQAPADDTWLPRHPCRDHSVTPVGPDVADLAAGLRQQPVLQVSKPVAVTVDGYSGLYLEVRIPDEVDAGRCVDDIVHLFSIGRNGDVLREEWQWEEGFVGRWWILDVDGKRIVVMPQCDTDCTAHDLNVLTTMAESVTFTSDE